MLKWESERELGLLPGAQRMYRACVFPGVLRAFLERWQNGSLQIQLQQSQHPQKATIAQLSRYFFLYLPEMLNQKDPIPSIRRIERQLNQTWLLLLPEEITVERPELARNQLEVHLSQCFATQPTPQPTPEEESRVSASDAPTQANPATLPGAIPQLRARAGQQLREAIELVRRTLAESEQLRLSLDPPPMYGDAWLKQEDALGVTIPFLEQLTAYLMDGAPAQTAVRHFLPTAEEGIVKEGQVALARMQRDLMVGVAIRWLGFAQFLYEAVPVEVSGDAPRPGGGWTEPILPLIQALGYTLSYVPLYGEPPVAVGRCERVHREQVLFDVPYRPVSGVVRVEVPVVEPLERGGLGIAARFWLANLHRPASLGN